MAKVGLILISYRTDPAPLFASVAQSRHDVRWYIFVHGDDKQLRAKLDAVAHTVNARYFPYGINRGVARSWNDGIIASMNESNDVTIMVNDDLFFYDGGFDAFVDFILAEEQRVPDFGLVWVHGKETGGPGDVGSQEYHNKTRPQEAACMAISKHAVEKVGFFDENFWPAYVEDYDYFYRLRLIGIPILCDERVLVEHDRSATARRDRIIRLLNQERWVRSTQYYTRKWGGRSLTETFTRPFNDQTLDGFIPAERRAAPFGPKYDRSDLGSAQSVGVLENNFSEELLGLLYRHAGSIHRYLEWGSSETTALMAEYAGTKGAEFFLSIDDDADRLRRIAARLPRYPFLHFRLVDADPDDEAGANASAHYVSYPIRLGIEFDVILIAGKFRMDCALLAHSVLAPDGLLIVHDEERARHQAIRQSFGGKGKRGALNSLGHWEQARDGALRKLYDVVEEAGQFVVLRHKTKNATAPPRAE